MTDRSDYRWLGPFAVTVVALLALGLGWWLAVAISPGHKPVTIPADLSATVLAVPKPIDDFSLIDQDGRPFDLQRLKGHWTFLFFGYTHCPDVCPTTMAVLGQLAAQLAETPRGLDQTQFALVSVDPARDTPAQLKRYVAYFGKDFLGVTGSEEAIAGLTRQLGVLYVRVPGTTDQNYTIDHSAAILLIDPRGRLSAVFSAPHDAERMARDFLRIRDIRA